MVLAHREKTYIFCSEESKSDGDKEKHSRKRKTYIEYKRSYQERPQD